MVFGEDFLLPLKSPASLYHRVEESHLEGGEYIKNSILHEFLMGSMTVLPSLDCAVRYRDVLLAKSIKLF